MVNWPHSIDPKIMKSFISGSVTRTLSGTGGEQTVGQRSYRKVVSDALAAIRRFCSKDDYDQSEQLVKTAPNLSIIVVGNTDDVLRVFKLAQRHKKSLIIRDLQTVFSDNRLTNIEGLQTDLYIDISVLRVISDEFFSTMVHDQSFVTVIDHTHKAKVIKPFNVDKIIFDEIGVEEFKDSMIGSLEGFKINQLTLPKPAKALPAPQYPGVSFTYPLPGRKRK